MHKISVKQLSKQFKQQVVLSNVSFEAQQGDIVALLGDSGCGKTTLLRCLNLLETPDDGLLQIDDFNIDFTKAQSNKKNGVLSKNELIKLRSKVGMVFQQFHLWPHLSVLQNLIEAPIQALKKK